MWPQRWHMWKWHSICFSQWDYRPAWQIPAVWVRNSKKWPPVTFCDPQGHIWPYIIPHFWWYSTPFILWNFLIGGLLNRDIDIVTTKVTCMWPWRSLKSKWHSYYFSQWGNRYECKIWTFWVKNSKSDLLWPSVTSEVTFDLNQSPIFLGALQLLFYETFWLEDSFIEILKKWPLC